LLLNGGDVWHDGDAQLLHLPLQKINEIVANEWS
jgi:hypothetical protein